MGIFMQLLLLLGGVAAFMFGMKTMNQGLEQSAGTGIKKLFKKLDKNRFANYGIGIGATAIVQSSSATSIMTVGLANAGVVTVKQGSGIVLGAKVGTTLTAFIFSIGLLNKGGFDISMIFAAIAFIGVIILFTTNKDNLKKLATFLIGFGLLFIGLEVMETAIGGADSVLSTQLTKLFDYPVMTNPVLLVLLGIILTLVIQSSTAATGLFLTFLVTGVITRVDQSFFLIMGANIGTCSDGLMASIGTNANGKRIAIFHVLTSAIGAISFTAILSIPPIRDAITNMFNNAFGGASIAESQHQWSLSIFNLSYNIIYTLILLAVLNPLVGLVNKIIKDKEVKEKHLSFIDERLLGTPAVAIEQSFKEVNAMAYLAQDNYDRAFNGFLTTDTTESKTIADIEYKVDNITRDLANYFIKISSKAISVKDEKLIGGLHHIIDDIERIGDHAVDFAKETNYMKQLNVSFSDQAQTELREIHSKLKELFDFSMETFKTRKTTNLKKISALHQEIIDLTNVSRNEHINRLNANKCSFEASKSLYMALLSLHRASDHLINIAFSIRSSTGSKAEAFASLEKEEKKDSAAIRCPNCGSSKVKDGECKYCGTIFSVK